MEVVQRMVWEGVNETTPLVKHPSIGIFTVGPPPIVRMNTPQPSIQVKGLLASHTAKHVPSLYRGGMWDLHPL